MRKLKKSRDIVVIVGKTGTGKTYYANEYLYEYNRVIIIDPLDEYAGLAFNTYSDLIMHCMDNPIFRVKMIDIQPDTLEEVSSIAYGLGSCCLCVEEAQRSIPWGREELPESFADILYRGRHLNLSLVVVAQRASTINIALRSQYTKIISFSQTEQADLEWLFKCTGYKEVYDLRTFTGHEHFIITPSGIEKISN